MSKKKTTMTNPLQIYQVRKLTCESTDKVRLSTFDFMANSEFVCNEITFDRACDVADTQALQGQTCVIIPMTIIFTTT